ncbi:transcriptional regulator [Haemophilus paracuniculus]|uniref:Transcriptional regulator n=1 Tax=Haemophilus paracuniculus TaxID=734 RepID=A0A1T0AWA4_9PAST|nr:helix-turn-helix transcriptional regulator [Haemophilus paracuniculus]OOS00728.1 transcriptional regulator [Haemophilus paracuniculus]
MNTEELTPHPIRYTFAKNLRKIRRMKDISQESLAFDAGISRAYLSEIEGGKRAVSIDVMGKIADALNVNLTLLLRTDDIIGNFLKEENFLSVKA